MKIKIIFLLPAFLLFSGCNPFSQKETPSPISTQITFVERQETGIVRKKEITLFETGTHTLKTTDGTLLTLKSSTIDLSRFENLLVEIKGREASNELGKIEVSAITPKNAPPKQRLSRFSEKYFIATLPGDWQRKEKGEKIIFTAGDRSAEIVVSVIEKMETITGNEAVMVGGQKGSRIINGQRTEILVGIPESEMGISFTFIPHGNAGGPKLLFYEMLSEIEWTTNAPSPLSLENADVCGGEARKICPAGFRCEFENLEPNAVGVCIDATLPPTLVSKVLSQKTIEKEEGILLQNPIPAGMTEYENTRWKYFFSIPKTWHWRHLGPRNESMSLLQIAEEEVLEENVLVEIRVEKGKKPADSQDIFYRDRDAESYFAVTGDESLRDTVKKIADSLRVKERLEEEKSE